MGSVEGSTMDFIAEQLWHWDSDNIHTGVDSEYYWDNLSDERKHEWHRKAVQIINLAEPVWRRRVQEDEGAYRGWERAVEHLEGFIGGELKRAAHADNPYRPKVQE